MPHGMMPGPMRLDTYLSLLAEIRPSPACTPPSWRASPATGSRRSPSSGSPRVIGSSGLAALVLALQTGGFAAASPLAGILADRVDRRRSSRPTWRGPGRPPLPPRQWLRHAVDRFAPSCSHRRGGLRADLVGVDAQPRGPRGPADRERPHRLAVGNDARPRSRPRWNRGRHPRPRCRVRRQRAELPRLGGAHRRHPAPQEARDAATVPASR